MKNNASYLLNIEEREVNGKTTIRIEIQENDNKREENVVSKQAPKLGESLLINYCSVHIFVHYFNSKRKNKP